jgi:hypothetical protein
LLSKDGLTAESGYLTMHGTDIPKGNRGAGYIRVSDGEKQDPQRQRETVARWADNRGLVVARLYEDIEGRNPRAKAERRAHFQQLLADVQAGKWDWIVVDSQERFRTKDAFEFGYFAHLFRMSGCQLWSVSQGHLTADDLGADTPSQPQYAGGTSTRRLGEEAPPSWASTVASSSERGCSRHHSSNSRQRSRPRSSRSWARSGRVE